MKDIRRRPNFLEVCVLALLALSLGVFGPATERAIAQAGTRQAIADLMLVSNSVPVLKDGFEGKILGHFWLPGNYGSGLHVPCHQNVDNLRAFRDAIRGDYRPRGRHRCGR